MKELYLLVAECVLCSAMLILGQEKRMNGMMMNRQVLHHDFGTRGTRPNYRMITMSHH